MNLCERLKAERERLGYSQTEFAAIAGASKHSQINWEKGAAAPNAVALAAWSAVGLDVLYVVTGQRNQSATSPAELPPRQRALLDNYEHMSTEDQCALERTASALAQSRQVRRAK